MIMKAIVGISILISVLSFEAQAQEKRRLDLDDLMVKGEIHNDDRLMILARQKNEMKNYVKFRTSFKEEMLQELPQMRHKQAF
jgi:hypothetical protein